MTPDELAKIREWAKMARRGPWKSFSSIVVAWQQERIDRLTAEVARLKKLEKACQRNFPWLLNWARAWHKQSGGYTATDTAIGLMECEQLAAVLSQEK